MTFKQGGPCASELRSAWISWMALVSGSASQQWMHFSPVFADLPYGPDEIQTPFSVYQCPKS